jgi:cytidylate kinase
MMEHISIAIDGPSGAGKSTLAKAAAEKLGYLYLDTGAIYRTVGLFAREQGVDPADSGAVTGLLDRIDIQIGYGEDGLQHMHLMGRDVTGAIRENEISYYASRVSAIPAVRDFLLELQRAFARENNVVMDGRDIGTVILPHAQVKIFLTATAQARAQRRYAELCRQGQEVTLERVLEEVVRRDETDTRRAAAPLRQAEDAVLLDTTGLDLEESLARLLEIIERKLGDA